jgi:hypothetical protein
MVLPLIIGFISGGIVGVIAEQKNRKFFPWAIYGFLFFFLAIIHIAAIGDRKYEELELDKLGLIKCPGCSKRVSAESVVCQYCNADLPKGRVESTTFSGEHSESKASQQRCRWCQVQYKETYGNKCPSCGGMQIHLLRENPLLIALMLCLVFAIFLVLGRMENEPIPSDSSPPMEQLNEF